MATATATQLAMAKTGQTYIASADGSAREEWMMVPGEHNFLDGLAASGGNQKSRGFRNEKGMKGEGAGGGAFAPNPVNPAIQKQMEELAEAHKAARGPSLMDQHREKKRVEKEEKRMKKGGEKWGWSRDDLDAGRRVDKEALKVVMGGSKELANKFQGSMSKSFM